MGRREIFGMPRAGSSAQRAGLKGKRCLNAEAKWTVITCEGVVESSSRERGRPFGFAVDYHSPNRPLDMRYVRLPSYGLDYRAVYFCLPGGF